MQKVYRLEGKVQHYAWGGDAYIPALLGNDNLSQEPHAEYWMGTHQRGPSVVSIEEEKIDLAALIEQAPIQILGEAVANQFNQKLPYLFKVLDVNKMLSIQSHPTKGQAEIGFERENKEGVDLTASYRNFKDDNHKPEVMVALTDFWLLHGFKSKLAIEDLLLSIPEFKSLYPHFQEGGIYHLYKTIMEMPQLEVDRLLVPLGARLAKQFMSGTLTKDQADYWAALAFRDNVLEGGHQDRGIFSIYLFNLVGLKKGEGIFQDAGIPHAYLEGVNMELMANSDNVFRGGLTYKHIDVDMLMKHLVFDSVEPHILKGEQISSFERVYKTPAPDFELSHIQINATDNYSTQSHAPQTLMIMEGAVNIKTAVNTLQFTKGTVAFLTAGTKYDIQAIENASLYKASVPV